MTWMVTVDPGKSYTAFALWSGADLTYAECVKENPKLWPNAARTVAYRVAQQVHLHTKGQRVQALYCEYPQIRKTTRSPNDQLGMVLMDGMLALALHPIEFDLVDPSAWKGTIDPDIVTQRVKDKLSEQELMRCATKDHNTFDAVGLGLWKLKRMHIGR